MEDNAFVRAVEKEIVKAVSHLDELTVVTILQKLSIYYKSFVEQDKREQRQALCAQRRMTKSDALET